MAFTPEEKQTIFQQYGKGPQDSGSPEAQIALFTKRIIHLTEHLKQNRHDFVTQRNLQRLVGKRRRMLNYLIQQDIFRYRNIIKELGIRR
jgi:small subunit ribosomal protein S15